MSDMQYYARNKNCSCARCRVGGLMAAAVLITIGVIALADQLALFRGGKLAPLLLIVIGAVLLLARSAPTEGHIPPWGTAPQAAPDAQDPWASGRRLSETTAPPLPPATTTQLPPASGTSTSQQANDQQVKP
jgi:hypothetical protein